MNNQDDDLNSFLDAFTACPLCGGERIEVAHDELPDDLKIQYKDMAPDLMGYLHCPACNEYSPFGGGGSFSDDFKPTNPIRLTALPSANGPCPCGSGKKYKRCCGKD